MTVAYSDECTTHVICIHAYTYKETIMLVSLVNVLLYVVPLVSIVGSIMLNNIRPFNHKATTTMFFIANILSVLYFTCTHQYTLVVQQCAFLFTSYCGMTGKLQYTIKPTVHTVVSIEHDYEHKAKLAARNRARRHYAH